MRTHKATWALSLLVNLACTDWEAAPGSPGSGGNAAGGAASQPGTGASAGTSSGGSATGGRGCAVSMGPTADMLPESYPRGLHAVGNTIEDADGKRITLRGVNRSGTEYKCAEGGGIFDGPSDEASVRAIASWNVNAVRIPLNESCWLGINKAPSRFSGSVYKQAILDYVALLHKYALIPILELHWATPGTMLAGMQLPMPNVDHSAELWTDVATTFKDDDGVVFEPFNEPFPDGNRDSASAWQCWRDGCRMTAPRDAQGMVRDDYDAIGMQGLVDAIRATGSEHLILLGGVQFSNNLSQWLTHQPQDPLPVQNLAAAWHVYNFNGCRARACWDAAPAGVAAEVPLVATEIGEDDCGDTFIDPLMQFLDEKGAGYLAWTWNAYGACVPKGQAYSLISDFNCPVPNSVFAETFRNHVQAAVP